MCRLHLFTIVSAIALLAEIGSAELVSLDIVPGTFPNASSVTASIDGGIIGSDEERSSISGTVVIDVDNLADPITDAELVELSLTLDDGFGFRLALGALRASAAPGSIVATITDPGIATPIMDGKFDQLQNLMGLEGVIDVSVQNESIDLSTLEPQPIDIEGVELGFQDDRLSAELEVVLSLEYEVEDVPVFGSIPVTIEIAGSILAISEPLVVASPGDFDGSGVLDIGDISALSTAVLDESQDLRFDLDNNGIVESADRSVWVESIAETYFGDANLDGEFNSADFVSVFQANEYEDSVVGNSSWATGDWNGDGDFDSSDFVAAFQSGGFEKGPRPAAFVPEPPFSPGIAGVSLFLLAWGFVRQRQSC